METKLSTSLLTLQRIVACSCGQARHADTLQICQSCKSGSMCSDCYTICAMCDRVICLNCVTYVGNEKQEVCEDCNRQLDRMKGERTVYYLVLDNITYKVKNSTALDVMGFLGNGVLLALKGLGVYRFQYRSYTNVTKDGKPSFVMCHMYCTRATDKVLMYGKVVDISAD